MPISKLNREAVLRAISEFDRLGRTEFLQTYGFGQSRSYFLRHESKDYDSKAIVGVAHGFVGDGHKTLSSTEFTGGDATVAQALRNLGFEVRFARRARRAVLSAICPPMVTHSGG